MTHPKPRARQRDRKLAWVEPLSKRDIERKTQYLIRQHQPEVLTDLVAFDVEAFFELDMERLTGVRGDYLPLYDGIDGYTDSEHSQCVISTQIDCRHPSGRYYLRSTMAHELGHVFLHVPHLRRMHHLLRLTKRTPEGVLLFREGTIPIYCNPEWQAHYFAGALLMPYPAVCTAIERGNTIQGLSSMFQVNPAFVETRLGKLNLLERVQGRRWSTG